MKKLNTFIKICIGVIILLFLVWIVQRSINNHERYNKIYEEAQTLIEQEQFDSAYGKLLRIDRWDFRERRQMLALCKAHIAYEEGDLETAYDLITNLALNDMSESLLKMTVEFEKQVTEAYAADQEEPEEKKEKTQEKTEEAGETKNTESTRKMEDTKDTRETEYRAKENQNDQKSSKKTSSSKKKSADSYDDGYNDIFDNEDYDWDRYQKDPEYAGGVDDAMDDYIDEFGEDW